MPTTNRLGIDLSTNHFDLCMLGSDGQLLIPPKRFHHDQPGSRAALDLVRPVSQAHPAEQLAIGSEATGLLWWHLYHQWAADPSLAELDPVFYLLNPAHVKNFRKSTAPQDKTDKLDARLIARYIGVPDQTLHPWTADLHGWPLRFLTRFRCHLSHRLAALKIYCHNWIYIKASAYDQIKPFAEPFGKTSLALLGEHPTLDALAKLPCPDLAEQIDSLGQRHFPNPEDNARQLQEVAKRSFPVDPAVAEAVHFIFGETVALIRLLEKHLATVDDFIAGQVAEDGDVHNLCSLGGLGPVYAAGLAAEIRPTARFFIGSKLDVRRDCLRPYNLEDAEAALAKWAGLWWPRRDSGQFKAEDRRLSKAGNAYLRYYLIEAANHVRGNVAEYKAFYDRKYREATKHHHHRALVLTARKLARLVFHLLHKHEPYQPRRTAQG